MAAYIQSVTDAGGASVDLPITVTGGNAIIVICSGNDTVGTFSSDVDGAFERKYSVTGLSNSLNATALYCDVLFNATAGAHVLSISAGAAADTIAYEVSGLGADETVLTNTSTVTSTTAITTGDVTTSGEAFLVMYTAYLSSCAETVLTPFTTWYLDASREQSSGVVTASGGTYNGDWTSSVSNSADSIIVAFPVAAAGTTIPIFSHHYTKNIG